MTYLKKYICVNKNTLMKKIILSAIMLIGLAFTAQAQDISKNALGLRFASNGGFGTEISFQRELSKNTVLKFNNTVKANLTEEKLRIFAEVSETINELITDKKIFNDK